MFPRIQTEKVKVVVVVSHCTLDKPFKLLQKLSRPVDNLCESVTVEIDHSKTRVVVSCVYRKPGTYIDQFTAEIEQIASSASVTYR